MADTYLRQGSPNRNQGSESIVRLQSSGKNRGLLSISSDALRAAIGSGNLVAARLELTISDNGENWGTTGRPVDLYQVTTPWSELGATWNCAVDADPTNSNDDCSGASRWAMDGPGTRPWVGTASASTVITTGQTGIVSLDVTNDVQGWLAGSANNGWILKKRDEGAAGRVDFGSRESASSPRIVLTVVPLTGHIVFGRRIGSSQRQVYVMAPDTSGIVNLSDGQTDDSWPDLTPDGGRAVFGRGSDLYAALIDGTGVQRQTETGGILGYPHFEKTGTRFVFACHGFDTSQEICTANADGSNLVQLTSNDRTDTYADYSADGSKIFFTSDRTGTSEIWVMNVDGSNPAQVTNAPGALTYGAMPSPDGTKLAYTVRSGGRDDIWVSNIDGSNPVRLTSTGHYFNSLPVWSPSGLQILYTSGCDTQNGIYTVCQLWLMNSNGSNQHMLLDHAEFARWR